MPSHDGIVDKYGGMAYVDLLRDCYKDELWGARLFELVSERRPMAPREQAVLGVLATLEKSMQGHLAFVLRRHGQDWSESDYAAQADAIARDIADRCGDLPWHCFNAQFEAGIDPYLQKYERLRSKAPEQDRAVMELFVEHEEAMRVLAIAEQCVESEMSLSAVWRVLDRSQALARAMGQRD
jgi:hypothetical protein